MNGKVKFYNAAKGFGFVTAEDGKEYFVHSSSVADGVTLTENDEITFEIEQGPKGPRAGKVVKK